MPSKECSLKIVTNFSHTLHLVRGNKFKDAELRIFPYELAMECVLSLNVIIVLIGMSRFWEKCFRYCSYLQSALTGYYFGVTKGD